MNKWLKDCKSCNMSADDFLTMVLNYARNDSLKAKLFSYIYLRERAENPKKPVAEIQEEMCRKFKVSVKTLEKYIYWK